VWTALEVCCLATALNGRARAREYVSKTIIFNPYISRDIGRERERERERERMLQNNANVTAS